MDGQPAEAVFAERFVVQRAHAPCGDVGAALSTIADQLGTEPFCLIAFFASSDTALEELAVASRAMFPGVAIIGCTTAGEISPDGYTSNEIVAVALPSEHFSTHVTIIDDLDNLDQQAVAADLMSARAEQAHGHPDWENEFAFLMVDGLSIREDQLSSVLSSALGPTPFFGGSAGDNLKFERTFVLAGGRVLSHAAVVALVRTRCPIVTFRLDHLKPTEVKMVVTGADPERRVVTEINAEPAAREYARILGKDPEQLSRLLFASHPVLVRIGGEHHVRAIREVLPNGDLVFFSAIDEGLVLTVAEPMDITDHLAQSLARLSRDSVPDTIIACDCTLRRVEVEQTQATGAMSRLLAANRVVGFNTYGEQSNGAHVNQTLTGVAIYPPD
ncbi:MAG: FIST N-terminal domain-containing protein [Pseudomonadota bacterium]